MKHIITSETPNPSESLYWVDLKENPYGGVVKYYDANLQEWLYFEEPLFKSSAAYHMTFEDLEDLRSYQDYIDFTANLQSQIDILEEKKIDREEAFSKEDAQQIYGELEEDINANTGTIATVNETLTNRIDEVDTQLNEEIDLLKDLVQQGYDDTEIKNALASKASYTYVEQQVQKITGVPPTVLDTLEELSAALGDDPNFAATVAEELGTKLNREQATDLFKELQSTLITETDPTVPLWAKKSTKPTYTADEVGALPTSTFIPELTSQLTNDAGFLTQLEVNALIQANKPLSDSQYFKINKTDSYIVYNITENSISLPIQYDTIVINVPEDITTLNVFFFEEPVVGSKFRIYINNKSSLTVTFYTLQNEVLHTVVIPAITRFDITAIDLTDYQLTTGTDNIITTENGSTIVVNILDGYIIDYVNMQNDLTWYEGE